MQSLIITDPPEPEESEMLYYILGVSKDATPEEVRTAYKKAANKHHPDKQDGDDRVFKMIKEAYDILIDPEKRAIYDATGIYNGEDAQVVDAARDFLSSIISATINDESLDLEHLDLVSALKKGINQNIKTYDKGIRRGEKSIKRLKKLQKRAKSSILISVFMKNISNQEEALNSLKQDKKIQEMALKIISTCKYEFDSEPEFRPPPKEWLDPFHVGFDE